MNRNQKERTIAIGDVHGCLSLLESLLQKIRYNASNDRLVFVGDLIDRGPSPHGVVRLVRRLDREGDVLTLMGNHEDKMLRWHLKQKLARETGKPNKMSPPSSDRLAQWEQLSEEDRAWLGKCPVVISPHPEWLAVHAGFEAVPMSDQEPDRMMRVRWVSRETGEHVGLDRDAKDPYALPEGADVWMSHWHGPKNVVYGHAIHSLRTPRMDRSPKTGVETWGIDTGAYAGGFLTALTLETREVTQVSDGQIYGKWFGSEP